MSVPNTLEALTGRIFSFYPPIRNVEHNEWEFRRAEWSELLVANTKTGLEVWIPRIHLGEISSVNDPVVIVGLKRELEYKAGGVWPYSRRVVEMPGGLMPKPAPPAATAPVRSATGPPPSTESRISRLILGVLIGGIALCLAIVAIVRIGPMRPVKFTAADQDFLSLNRHDDYFSVVRKLGEPAESRWKAQTGELQYRSLWYPNRSYYIILFGTDRGDERYIGALDRNWHVVHYVELPNGASTASMLRGLGKF
jgi:hypothetical protein